MEDPDRWQAVLARDAGQDGRFVYAVRSTGIFCRPSCPAKRPGREQVEFFSNPEGAKAAGYRPCRRCRPDEAATSDKQLQLVQLLCDQIRSRPDSPPTLAQLSAQVGVSPHHLQRTFRRLMGVTPRQFAEACRLGQLKEHLKNGEEVTTALYEVGYGSSSRLYERAPLQLGMTPAAYRRGGSGARMGYTVVDSPLGRLLVAATERGVSAVSLGDRDEELEAGLRKEYPSAEIYRDDAGLSPWASLLVGHLSGRQPHLDLPLDVRATAFRWQVWQQLRSIPFGDTRSYGEIARSLGRPAAVRAVARACAANPLALVIPCHRAVRQDGDPGGYRWGTERKRLLLARERDSRDAAGE